MFFDNTILVVGGTLTGLVAGLLFSFSVAIVPALRLLKPKVHLEIMQKINVKILNPVFMLSFLGPSFLLPLAAFLYRSAAAFPLLLASAVLYLIGVTGVTIAGNAPLNYRLDRVKLDQCNDTEAERIRQEFNGAGAAWMRLHSVRTIASIAATVLVLIACLVKGGSR